MGPQGLGGLVSVYIILLSTPDRRSLHKHGRAQRNVGLQSREYTGP